MEHEMIQCKVDGRCPKYFRTQRDKEEQKAKGAAEYAFTAAN